MRKYQSHGMGLNSVALSELLDNEVERVNVDPGGEHPLTYLYEPYYLEHQKVTVLHPEVEGFNNIYNYYFQHVGCAPFRAYRSCTDRWKSRPLSKYYKAPSIVYIGIAYDERHRVKLHEKNGITYEYPLVDEKVTRKGCIEIVEDAGLKTPPKSGCYFCPFQSKQSWMKLAIDHPEHYQKAIELEELSPNIDLYPKGLRWLQGRMDEKLEQTKLVDEDWECQFCMS